ncbi:uncharacterized protein Ecym_2418 [Eremothecium cymbalariae DBVPG|uniref:Uncharacterized protein n=1 Tax=Eremothecium cymbalariae (strain CBS 270.75 / DBVPG 7215 / KCTC 17166 / NRRL Y-17582) TaxID=931890 RepID=G8JP92_ERECY|nr:Hypothetical protein Ecym_2418 [Eremothecium cymbalariae DBVPG\
MVKKQVIRKKPKADGTDLVVKQKLIWTVGHICTLVFGLYFAFYSIYRLAFFYRYRSWKTLFLTARRHISGRHFSWLKWLAGFTPNVAYRLSLVGVLASHGITTWQSWADLSPTYYDLLCTDNFQNLLIATLWLFTRTSFYKLVPFIIVSYLHLTKKKNTSEQDITRQNSSLLHVVAYSEIVVLVSLFMDTLMFRGTSGFAFVFYLAIYWLKVNFSPYVQNTVLRILSKFDKAIPGSQQGKWNSAKNFLVKRLQEQERSQKEVRKRL